MEMRIQNWGIGKETYLVETVTEKTLIYDCHFFDK
jgi:hypothetical protein